MENIEKLYHIIQNSNYCVFFGGAGTSTDSGIKDFRGKNGLYKTNFLGYRPEEILSHSFLLNNYDIFIEYVNNNLSTTGIQPNKGHFALVKLEQIGKLKAIITQNIDNLHQEAGSKNVIELHGTLKKWYCMNCNKKNNNFFKCECGGKTRPEVTLYEEMLDENATLAAINHIKKADTLIISGTSLTVYPAANYINYFSGKNLVIINEEELNCNYNISLHIKGNFAEVFHKLIQLF